MTDVSSCPSIHPCRDDVSSCRLIPVSVDYTKLEPIQSLIMHLFSIIHLSGKQIVKASTISFSMTNHMHRRLRTPDWKSWLHKTSFPFSDPNMVLTLSPLISDIPRPSARCLKNRACRGPCREPVNMALGRLYNILEYLSSTSGFSTYSIYTQLVNQPFNYSFSQIMRAGIINACTHSRSDSLSHFLLS